MVKVSRFFMVFLLVVFLAPSFAHAKKPVKLSGSEMGSVEGAVAPIVIVGAMAGAYALSVSIDLISDPEVRDALGGITDNAAKGDWASAHKHSQLLHEKEVKAMTDPVNIIAGLAGGVGKIAGAAFKGATGSVKIGQTGLNAAKPFALGAGKVGIEQGSKIAFKVPATCLVKNNYTLGNETNACAYNGFSNEFSDPLLWASVVSGGMTRGEAYNVRSGYSGPQLLKVSEMKTGVEVIDKSEEIGAKINKGLSQDKKNNDKKNNKDVESGESDRWIVQTPPYCSAPQKVDTSVIDKYPGGKVYEKDGGYYYELPDKKTTSSSSGSKKSSSSSSSKSSSSSSSSKNSSSSIKKSASKTLNKVSSTKIKNCSNSESKKTIAKMNKIKQANLKK